MCEPTCGKEITSCIEMCGPAKCQCKPGYKRDSATGMCVQPAYCSAATTDPCASNPCAFGSVCVPERKECFSQPCPQYRCDDACASNPCGFGQTCTPAPKNCFTIPCPQYECSADAGVPDCFNSRIDSTGGVVADGLEVPLPQLLNQGCRVRAGILTVDRTPGSGFTPLLTTTEGTTLSLGVYDQMVTTAGSAVSLVKKVPANSCHVYGCRDGNEWATAADGSSSCLLNFALSQGEACFCDDACTQFRDCCEDYQATCL
jgi:hypothetical protein